MASSYGGRVPIRVDCIHLKIADKKFWEQMPEIISMIRKAREQGADIHARRSNPRARL